MYDLCVKVDGQWRHFAIVKHSKQAVGLLKEAGLKGPDVCVAQVGSPTSVAARKLPVAKLDEVFLLEGAE